jgi:hypothetical protein
MLAYITGTVDQELLLRNEYRAAENRILKVQIKTRLLLSDAEKATLAEIGRRLGDTRLSASGRKTSTNSVPLQCPQRA